MASSDSETGSLSAFAAEVVTYEDDPSECTIYPEDVPDHRQRTTWITAKEGSFVAASDCR